jgi:hypothetical protein
VTGRIRPLTFIVMTTALATVLLGAGAALGQTADYRFHWAPCATYDADGQPLAEAVQYDIWLRRGANEEVLIGTVQQDTIYTLAADPFVVQRIRVCGYDEHGRQSPMSEWSEPVYFETGRAGETVPPVGRLRPNYPNPFNPETRIVYGVPEELGEGGAIQLEVLDLQGRRVRLLEIDRTPGWHEVSWDGKNDRGIPQATGVYLTRFLCGTAVDIRKMTMLK